MREGVRREDVQIIYKGKEKWILREEKGIDMESVLCPASRKKRGPEVEERDLEQELHSGTEKGILTFLATALSCSAVNMKNDYRMLSRGWGVNSPCFL